MEATGGRADVPEPSTPPQPTLTVAAVARRLGVAPPTLRTWDRRYGLGPSAHTAGAHRRYSPADVARLMVMRQLTLQGVAPADAAAIALAADNPDGVQLASITSITDRADRPQDGDGADRPADPEDPRRPDEPRSRDERRGDRREDRRDDWSREDAPSRGADRYAEDRYAGDRYAEDRYAGDRYAGDRYGDRYADDRPAATPRYRDPAYDPESEDVADAFADDDLLSARRAGVADVIDPGNGRGSDLLDSPWREEPGAEIETPWLGVLRARQGRGGPAGGGRVIALPDGTPMTRGLARAAMSLDTQQTTVMLRDAVRRGGVVTTWETMAVPVLQALGERTGATGDGIDVEHAFSEVLLGVLRGVVFSLRQPRNAAPVLLACAEDDYHSLPLHVLAAALAEREVGCRMLGSGLPPHALAAAVRRSGPSAVVLHAQMPGADAGHVDELRRQRPAPRIILGGPGWRAETVPAGARSVTSLGEAIDEVLVAVHL